MLNFDIFDALGFDLFIRVLVSIALGFMIGVERELTNKSAGLRTHILVCLGATVFTILSIYGFADIKMDEGVRIAHDPARIAAQIITGIGFIGGGAVLHHGVSVYGLTTAATLWITSSIGMAVGTGSYQIAIVAAFLTLLVLIGIRKLEKGVLEKYTKKEVKVKVSIISKPESVTEIQDWIYKQFDDVVEMTVSKASKDDDVLVKIAFIVEIFESDPINKVYRRIKDLKSIESLTLQQIVDENSII